MDSTTRLPLAAPPLVAVYQGLSAHHFSVNRMICGKEVHCKRRFGASPGIARRSATCTGAGQVSQDGGGLCLRGTLGGWPWEGRLGKAGGGDCKQDSTCSEGVRHPAAAPYQAVSWDYPRMGIGLLVRKILFTM